MSKKKEPEPIQEIPPVIPPSGDVLTPQKETMTNEELAKTTHPKSPELPIVVPEEEHPVESGFDEAAPAPAEDTNAEAIEPQP